MLASGLRPRAEARHDATTAATAPTATPAPRADAPDPPGAGAPQGTASGPDAGARQTGQPHPPRPANPVTAGTGLRVAALGAPRGMAGAVRLLGTADGLHPEGPHGPRHLDAVLVDADTPLEATATGGLPVIREVIGDGAHPPEPGTPDPATPDPATPDPAAPDPATPDPAAPDPATPDPAAPDVVATVVEVGAGARGGPWPLAVVDTAVHNPLGVRFDAARPPVVCDLGRGVDETLAEARDAFDGEVVALSDPRLHSHLGVVDHARLHADPAARATRLTELTCAGVPVVVLDAPLPDEATRSLTADLAAALNVGVPADLADAHRRDRLGVAQRRVALRGHYAERAWRAVADHADLHPLPAPTVSVLLATNRPERVLAATARFAAFRYPHRELVVALHGGAFDAGVHDPTTGRLIDAERLDDHLAELAGAPTTVLRVDGATPLGGVLDRATWASAGELVTKLDDDDRYDVDHLDDLVAALRYADAELVGKGSEFIHLGEIDVTVRRLPKGAESSSRTVAGGTLMLGRDVLRSVGGWQHASRSVDQLLIDDVLAAGGRLHRTHGYGFVLDRHVEGHTWASPTEHFLRRAVAQWPGVALDPAGFRAGDPGAAYLPDAT